MNEVDTQEAGTSLETKSMEPSRPRESSRGRGCARGRAHACTRARACAAHPDAAGGRLRVVGGAEEREANRLVEEQANLLHRLRLRRADKARAHTVGLRAARAGVACGWLRLKAASATQIAT
eukprot:3917231-Pleurochrysis_carterae.AAC.2